MRTAIVRSLAVAAAGALLIVATPMAAQAATAPKPGAKCGNGTPAMSGLTKIVKGNIYICQTKGDSTVWSKGLPKSKLKGVTITDTAVKLPTMPTMTGMFGKITNNGSKTVRIIGGYTDVAKVVQMHTMQMVDGTMQMVPVAGGFKVKPGETFTLQPGGNHVMLMDLTTTLTAGQSVSVHLVTNKGAVIKVTSMVRSFSGGDEPYDPMPGMS